MSTSRVFSLPVRRRVRILASGLGLLVLGAANLTLGYWHLTKPPKPRLGSKAVLSADNEKRPDPQGLMTVLPPIGSMAAGLIFLGAGLGSLRRSILLGGVDIAADEKGLWKADRPPESSFLPWQDIASTQEHSYLKRLDLIDLQGKTRLHLDYELEELYELRSMVSQRMSPPANNLERLPMTLTVPPSRLLGLGSVLILFLILGFYSLALGHLLPFFFSLISFALAGVLGYQIATIPKMLTVERDFLVLGYPLGRMRVQRGQIDGVRIEVGEWGLFQGVQLLLCLRDNSPAKLYFEAMPPTDLQRLLEDWLDRPVEKIARP